MIIQVYLIFTILISSQTQRFRQPQNQDQTYWKKLDHRIDLLQITDDEYLGTIVEDEQRTLYDESDEISEINNQDETSTNMNEQNNEQKTISDDGEVLGTLVDDNDEQQSIISDDDEQQSTINDEVEQQQTVNDVSDQQKSSNDDEIQGTNDDEEVLARAKNDIDEEVLAKAKNDNEDEQQSAIPNDGQQQGFIYEEEEEYLGIVNENEQQQQTNQEDEQITKRNDDPNSVQEDPEQVAIKAEQVVIQAEEEISEEDDAQQQIRTYRFKKQSVLPINNQTKIIKRVKQEELEGEEIQENEEDQLQNEDDEIEQNENVDEFGQYQSIKRINKLKDQIEKIIYAPTTIEDELYSQGDISYIDEEGEVYRETDEVGEQNFQDEIVVYEEEKVYQKQELPEDKDVKVVDQVCKEYRYSKTKTIPDEIAEICREFFGGRKNDGDQMVKVPDFTLQNKYWKDDLIKKVEKMKIQKHKDQKKSTVFKNKNKKKQDQIVPQNQKNINKKGFENTDENEDQQDEGEKDYKALYENLMKVNTPSGVSRSSKRDVNINIVVN